ncbi:PaaI family thioesterase [Saccharopolyspora cebuensis]|uniref:PaaI family thioesterase n=1 Tax=Saccharopolyspora cebuensis TaxID=418759 RepID=A0ABV4CIB3_9PSEU
MPRARHAGAGRESVTAHQEPPVELTAAAREDGVDAAAAAARRLIDSLLRAGDGTEVAMSGITEQLTAIADRLDAHAPPFDERMVAMWAGDATTRHDPVTGPENALAPPVRFAGAADGSVSAVVELGVAYQGQPGCAHGGVSALLLDHALGVANHWGGRSGMTAELTLRYRAPVPLFVPLAVTGRQVAVDGRKLWAEGAISTPDGAVCVAAKGFFIGKHLPRPR